MRRLVVPVLAIVAVASLAVAPGRADGPTFGAPVRVGGGITEPGIDISSNGAIFVHGPAGTPGRSRLWRSADGGASYQAIAFDERPYDKWPGGGDSDVVTRGDRVYFFDLWVVSNSIAMSDDNGDTWTLGNPVTTLPLSDRQWLALGPRDAGNGFDTLYALYALIEQPRQVMLARSRTSGLTWESHVAAPGALSASGFTGQLLSDGNEFLAFTWEDGGVLSAAVSEDGGDTWRSSQIARGAYGTIPGLALDGDSMHAVWVACTRGGQGCGENGFSVQIASSTDRGLTWSAPRQLSAPATSNMFPWVDARAGKVAVAWYSADVEGDPNDVPETTQWRAVYSERSSPGAPFTAPVVLGNAKTGIICTAGLSCDLNGTGGRELGDFMSVAIDADGKSLVAYGGRVGVGIRVAKQIS